MIPSSEWARSVLAPIHNDCDLLECGVVLDETCLTLVREYNYDGELERIGRARRDAARRAKEMKQCYHCSRIFRQRPHAPKHVFVAFGAKRHLCSIWCLAQLRTYGKRRKR